MSTAVPTSEISGNADSVPVVDSGKLYTPEELLSLPNENGFELVGGRLVERNMGNWSSFVASNVLVAMGAFVRDSGAGWVFNSDAGFRLSPDSPATIRRPDVSFVRRGRLPDETPSAGYDALAPDLAVEVLSPHDLFIDVDTKREEYLRAGVRLLWIVSPQTKTIQVFRADGTTSLLHENDDLSGEDVLPGFGCRVSSLFARAVGQPS